MAMTQWGMNASNLPELSEAVASNLFGRQSWEDWKSCLNAKRLEFEAKRPAYAFAKVDPDGMIK